MGKLNHTPAQRAAMRHNSCIGLAVAIQKNLRAIGDSPTLTAEAQVLVGIIELHLRNLEKALRAGRKS